MLALIRGDLHGHEIPQDDGPSDADVEAMFNAHVSAHLAALPRAYLALVPPDLADLIRQAKEFHVIMDARGEADEAQLALSEVGFHPRHHVKLRLGPYAGQYMAIPATVRCEYTVSPDASVERVQIERAGGTVVDAFGNRVQ
ncbi:hypothetical protein IQ289_31130 [Burkholderia sp. R-70006]|uniref:hypothetical protein n=1 Tax=Paraburkholderia domus TaxID=2793075 RepID=UPI0019146CDC|nr:hypothetical protein [Paraburkholderia domus]MBK5052838.1 hypothetical protein [Burkholderia sp. R-70006]